MNIIEKRIKELGFAEHKPADYFSIAVIVKNTDNKYLIMQRSFQDTDGAGLWDIVGGSVDSIDPHECAIRELQEEASLEVTELKYFTDRVYNCPWINEDKLRIIFEHHTKVEPKVSFEHEQYKWVTIEELQEHEFFLDYLKEAVVEHHKINS
jgi:8-oxo-dGTP diphosphatase